MPSAAALVRVALLVVASYAAGRRMSPLPLALAAFLAAAVGAAAYFALPAPAEAFTLWMVSIVTQSAANVLPWWVGRYRRLRTEQVRAERHIVAEGARQRERARIAQEIHDTLGHELALIALGSGALELAEDATDEQRRAAAEWRARAGARGAFVTRRGAGQCRDR